MKPVITNLQSVLTYHLEGMYDAEKQIQKVFPELNDAMKSATLREELLNYRESASDKRMKLKRIFSYLLTGPFDRKNNIVKEQLQEVNDWTHLMAPSSLRDRMVIDSIQDLIQTKLEVYGTAKSFAEELKLNSVADLLDEITTWEIEASRKFKKLAVRHAAKTEKAEM